MTDLPAEVEQQIANLSEAEWQAFTARVRAPDGAAKFREAASKVIDGDRLEAVCRVANLSAFVNDKGEIDEAQVESSLRNVFGIPAPAAHQNFGQFSEPPTMPGPGDSGRAEARKRFGGGTPAAPSRGNGGYHEAQRRFHQNGAADK
jgi:hypothetical protein